MRISSAKLRRVIRQILTEAYSYSGSEPDEDYRPADEKNLMLDQPGMEEEDRENVKHYLGAMGMIKT
jgi:hypothetical protein